jgi:hypothetical protein
MNREQLEDVLNKEHISPNIYSLNGPDNYDNRFILEERYGTWYAYYFERGEKINEQIFSNEDEACRYLLKKILDDPISRLVK